LPALYKEENPMGTAKFAAAAAVTAAGYFGIPSTVDYFESIQYNLNGHGQLEMITDEKVETLENGRVLLGGEPGSVALVDQGESMGIWTAWRLSTMAEQPVKPPLADMDALNEAKFDFFCVVEEGASKGDVHARNPDVPQPKTVWTRLINEPVEPFFDTETSCSAEFQTDGNTYRAILPAYGPSELRNRL
jgi:hypothetical protein